METNAVIGGEESGGFGIRGHIPERDGILIGMLFADMIVRRGKPLSEILRDLEQRVGPHAYARHDIHLQRDTYDRDRKRITEQLANHQPKEIAGVKVARVRSDDGFKFYLEDGSWVLFRTSGTEALVRIYSEAPDAADAAPHHCCRGRGHLRGFHARARGRRAPRRPLRPGRNVVLRSRLA